MAFTQLLDRGLTSDVVLASWCPTMDLLALVMSDSQLSVNRLNKQRLWVLAPDSKITAITWQPDGKILAIALQVRWHLHPLTCMSKAVRTCSHTVTIPLCCAGGRDLAPGR